MPKYLMMMTAAGVALASANASAQEYYLAGDLGLVFSGDSSNSGDVNEDFILGLGAGGLSSDASYRFETDFEIGGFASIAVGKNTPFGPLRSELELSYSRSNVQEHNDLQALGANLADVDVGALIGAEEPVGLNIGRVLEDGKGQVSTIGLMVNGFYDFAVPNSRVHPYIGAGLGVMRINVEYDPSGLDLVDDNATSFGYQVMAGIDYDLTEARVLHAGFRYRGAQPAEVETNGFGGVDFDSDLDVDVDQFIAEIGYRWKF
jgi:opacity protein-like surface antigen